jgi:hypothetical protein
MGWVEDEANKNALLHRDGPERWRDIKTSIREAVEDYTRIYSPPGVIEIQYTSCAPSTENCVRVRIMPSPGEKDVSFEITIDPATWKIQCDGLKALFTLGIVAMIGEDAVAIFDGDGKSVLPEDVSKEYLKPLFAKLPVRRPNVAARS